MNCRPMLIKVLCFILLTCSSVYGEDLKKPDPPPLKWDGLGKMKTVVSVSVSADQPFGFTAHKEANAMKAMPKVCFNQLNRAIYWQDTYHQFQSKAHFDNCDFKGALDYIQKLYDEAQNLALRAKKENEEVKNETIKLAMFSLGQALHAIQDFYAHSNYVELMEKRYEEFDDVPSLKFWTEDGRKTLEKLAEAKELHTGRVWWGFPKLCEDSVPSHEELAKDSESTESGEISIEKWEDLSRFQAAQQLSNEASLEFIKDSFKKMPILGEVCGTNAIYTVFVDRRNLKK